MPGERLVEEAERGDVRGCADTARVPQREVDRDLAALAAPDSRSSAPRRDRRLTLPHVGVLVPFVTYGSGRSLRELIPGRGE